MSDDPLHMPLGEFDQMLGDAYAMHPNPENFKAVLNRWRISDADDLVLDNDTRGSYRWWWL